MVMHFSCFEERLFCSTRACDDSDECAAVGCECSLSFAGQHDNDSCVGFGDDAGVGSGGSAESAAVSLSAFYVEDECSVGDVFEWEGVSFFYFAAGSCGDDVAYFEAFCCLDEDHAAGVFDFSQGCQVSWTFDKVGDDAHLQFL